MFDTAMRWLGMGLCHQLPARSFFGGGHQLPVCARDTGIYIGFVASLLIVSALERGRRRTGMPPVWLLATGAGLIALLGWDGVTSYAGLRATTNLIRFATGLGTGFALTLIIAPVLNGQLWRRNSEGRLLGSGIEGVAWLAALVATGCLVYFGGPLLQIGYPLLVAACILVTFTAVNLVVVSLVPRFERQAERLRDAWPALLVALAATLAELVLTDWLRLALLRFVSRG
jgi:uncharacterized membrane protein